MSSSACVPAAGDDDQQDQRRRRRGSPPAIRTPRPRDAVTSGFVVRSRTVPTTRSIVSAMSAAQFGSVNGLPAMAEETSPRHLGGSDGRRATRWSSRRGTRRRSRRRWLATTISVMSPSASSNRASGAAPSVSALAGGDHRGERQQLVATRLRHRRAAQPRHGRLVARRSPRLRRRRVRPAPTSSLVGRLPAVRPPTPTPRRPRLGRRRPSSAADSAGAVVVGAADHRHRSPEPCPPPTPWPVPDGCRRRSRRDLRGWRRRNRRSPARRPPRRPSAPASPRAWRRRSSDATLAGGVGGSGSAAVARNSSNVASAAATAASRCSTDGASHCGDRRRGGAQTLDLGQQNRVGLDASALVGGGLAVEVGAGQLGVVGFLVVSHQSIASGGGVELGRSAAGAGFPSRVASNDRPRAMRDLTVPAGMSSVSAISA